MRDLYTISTETIANSDAAKTQNFSATRAGKAADFQWKR